MKKPKLSIIIVTLNQPELLSQCLDQIYAVNTKDYEIILIDNGSFPPCELGYYGKLIRNEKNIGFPIAVNQGLRVAKGEYLCLANDDTLVFPGWDKLLLSHLDKYDAVAAVGCNMSGIQNVTSRYYSDLDGYRRAAKEIADNNRGKAIPHYRLCFHYMTMKRKVFETVGFVDEQFTPGNFEDDDYSLRMIQAGFKIAIASDVYIHHYGSATFKEKVDYSYSELIKRNAIKFGNKWSMEERERLASIPSTW